MDGKKVTLKHVKTSPYTFTIFIDKETLHMFKSVIIFSQDKVGKKNGGSRMTKSQQNLKPGIRTLFGDCWSEHSIHAQ